MVRGLGGVALILIVVVAVAIRAVVLIAAMDIYFIIWVTLPPLGHNSDRRDS